MVKAWGKSYDCCYILYIAIYARIILKTQKNWKICKKYIINLKQGLCQIRSSSQKLYLNYNNKVQIYFPYWILILPWYI